MFFVVVFVLFVFCLFVVVCFFQAYRYTGISFKFPNKEVAGLILPHLVSIHNNFVFILLLS